MQAPSFDPADVRFVLVQPLYAGNLGSTARALKNLGFSRLELVDPRCDPLGDDARTLAVDAGDVLEQARIHAGLDAALEGAGTVVGATQRTGKHRRPHWRLDELAADLARLAANGELALVFGREDSGLTDLELDRCTHLVQIPTAEAYPSLNVAQAVLLVAYELRRAGLPPIPSPEPTSPADHAAREAMYEHLREALLAIGFLHSDNVEPIVRRFRRLLGRAEMTPEEVQLLRGVARQTLWAAGKAGLVPPGEPES